MGIAAAWANESRLGFRESMLPLVSTSSARLPRALPHTASPGRSELVLFSPTACQAGQRLDETWAVVRGVWWERLVAVERGERAQVRAEGRGISWLMPYV